MPIRAFVSQDIPRLQATLAILENALQSGSIQEVRVAGILTTTGPIKQQDVQLRYMQCRYELYLRVKCLPDDSDTGGKNCALKEQYGKDPYQEKAMQVHSRSSVGVFGYPLPAPLVPPEP